MAAPIYSITTGGAVALSAATAKSVIGVKAHPNSGVELRAVTVSFDGVSASAVPVLIELCHCTYAGDGTSTSRTPAQISGVTITPGFTGAANWTSEPTSLTVVDEWLLTPNGGHGWIDVPLGNEYTATPGQGFVVRMNAPAAVNTRAGIKVSRI